MAKRVLLFSRIQAAKHQDASFDARVAQQYAFVRGGHAKPLRPCLLQRGRAFLDAMAVSIALHNSAYGDFRAHVLLHDMEIVAQSRERNLGPVGTGFDARGCKSRGQILMIQAVIGGSLVVSGLVSGFESVLLFQVGALSTRCKRRLSIRIVRSLNLANALLRAAEDSQATG